MPRVGLYVTRADKEVLDGLPDGVTGAALLRQAIRLYRMQGEECSHPGLLVVCPDCGYREKAPSGDEDPMQTGSEPDGDTRPSRRRKAQVS